MATFGIRVFKHHEKKDGTFNVKIRITQERRSAYIDTSHFVTAKMLSKNYEVKDIFILKDLYGTLSDYREAVSRLGSKVNYMDADDIKSFLEKRSEKIDFLAFCQQHIDLLVANDRSKTATGFRTVRYAPHTITMVASPFCGHCPGMYMALRLWLSKRKDLKLQIVFSIKNDKSREQVVSHIMSIYHQKGTRATKEALTTWFFWGRRNYKRWAKQFPAGESSISTQATESQRNWCYRANIVITPTVFIDGFKLPKLYGVNDIKYLI